MTSTKQGNPGALPARPGLKLWLSLLHLAAYGTFGLIFLSILVAWFAAGIGLTFLLGFGLILLVGLLYTIFGAARLEIRRVSDLFDLGIPALQWVGQQRPGFGGYVRCLLNNLKQGRMWAAFGSFAVTCFLGATMLGGIEWMIRLGITSFAYRTGITTIAGPFGLPVASGDAPWMFPLAIIGAGLAFGMVYLHRAITVSIIGSSALQTQLTEKVRTTTVQREGALRAAELERTRIERDLHDGVQPRLVSVAMTLGLAHQQIDGDPQQAKALVAEAHTSTKSAITELRQLTRGIYASVLDDRGLDAALSAIAGRSHIPVQLDVQLSGRYARHAEAALYFAIAEALTNAAKHSRASSCRVTVRERNDENEQPQLWARIEDNGTGGASITPGGGLDGITNRITAAGGTFTLDSPQGGPTALEVKVPCAS